ncbi:MAG: glycoside hydrolase family 3 C-terminal domain-containing protein [Desulfobacteraceae bacterium]
MINRQVLFLLASVFFIFSSSMSYTEPAPLISGLPDPAGCKPSKSEKPWLDKTRSPECRALDAVNALTEEEKIYFGYNAFTMPGEEVSDEEQSARDAARKANEKLGLSEIGGSGDGPNGIADMSSLFGSEIRDRSLNVTAFPNVINLGATWDRDLAKQFGLALGEEFSGKGMASNLGPTINIIRSWHGGRSAETFGEDPFHMGELVVPEIIGMQSKGVIATMKHYAANNQEFSRVGNFPSFGGTDEQITEKALREIYLPAYKAAVQRARVGSVMCAYNRINGEFCCNSPDLLGRLREWGYDGTIVPDAVFAQRDAVKAAKAGVTSASPVVEIAEAMKKGEIDEHYFDRKAYYTLVTRFRHGLYEKTVKGSETADVSTPEHIALARKIASEGAVLLKNDNNALPVNQVKSIAVIGADAGPEAVVMETGSPNVHVRTLSVPIDAIKNRAGDIPVMYERGTAGVRTLYSIPAAILTPPDEKGHGLRGEYFHTPWYWSDAVTRIDPKIEFGEDPGIPPAPESLLGKMENAQAVSWSAKWTGFIIPPKSGEYAFSVSGTGTADLYINNKLVTTIQHTDFPAASVGVVDLTKDKKAKVLLKYNSGSAVLGAGIKMGWMPPDDRLQKAIDAAKKSHAAIVFVGEQLGEGSDKIFFSLPGDQNRLIEEIARVNSRTIVVFHTSTPVAMPWIDKVEAVIQAWYPGQEAGTSIADILFGDVNPSGKLPVTFPMDAKQGPSHWMIYPGDGLNMIYDEGILVGYRWYDAMNQEPLFPFGHGLSYTEFQYSDLEISGTGNDRIVRLNVKNTGDRAGAEVVQLYVGVPEEAQEPPKQLKGFEKIMLDPGETKSVTIPLTDENIMMFDENDQEWKLFKGEYQVMVGSSSRDIRVAGGFVIN